MDEILRLRAETKLLAQELTEILVSLRDKSLPQTEREHWKKEYRQKTRILTEKKRSLKEMWARSPNNIISRLTEAEQGQKTDQAKKLLHDALCYISTLREKAYTQSRLFSKTMEAAQQVIQELEEATADEHEEDCECCVCVLKHAIRNYHAHEIEKALKDRVDEHQLSP